MRRRALGRRFRIFDDGEAGARPGGPARDADVRRERSRERRRPRVDGLLGGPRPARGDRDALPCGADLPRPGTFAVALYDPVFVSGVTGPPQFALAALCFVLLVAARLPSWAVVLVGAAGGVLVAALTGIF